MQKAYSRINWENEPSTSTPLNEDNLNAMDSALDTIDDRVCSLSGYSEQAKEYRDQAQTYATNSSTSATNSESYSELSKSYAVGTNGTKRSGDATDNAKYYSEQASSSKAECQRIEQDLGNALVYKGTLTYAQWQALIQTATLRTGYVWNISDEFTTDSTFKEGSGIDCGAGTNVARTDDGMWDLFGGSTGGTSVGIELTQAEYDALPSTKLTDGVDYYITDATQTPFNVIECTQAEYDALTDTQKAVGQYLITDVDGIGDASEVGYGSGSVKDALDGRGKCDILVTTTIDDTNGANGTCDFSPYRYVIAQLLGAGSDNVWSEILIPTSQLVDGDYTQYSRHRLFAFNNATTFIGYHFYIAKGKYKILNGGSSTWTASNFRLRLVGIK